jgi:hypothetical protein
LELQTAWALVNMRIVGRSVGALDADASLRDAELWFLGSIDVPSRLSDGLARMVDLAAVRELERFEYDEDFRDLLPYVLDAIGPGSRASVMKDPETDTARRAKKASGVFYTPADVAEYITREAVAQLRSPAGDARVLDPACGSGVFLRAALQSVCERWGTSRVSVAESSLFGIDINPLAIEAACFVLLHDCLLDTGVEASPWSVWHSIRCNFCVLDSLSLNASEPSSNESNRNEIRALRARLATGYVPPSNEPLDCGGSQAFFGSGIELGTVLPLLDSGADIVVGNPPYAAVGARDDIASLGQRYQSIVDGRSTRADLYPFFVEMMWRLSRNDQSSAGMVVPLSIAYSTRAQIAACRRAMMATCGKWRFAFFDREPHALFGEEVKTRNAILFYSRVIGDTIGGHLSIESGPLRKWTSRQRPKLFESITFTPLTGTSIAAGIPKLDGRIAADVYARLNRLTTHLREACTRVGTSLPAEASRNHDVPRVFVAGTAYNFINVFQHHRKLPESRVPWSESTLTTLDFDETNMASAALAMLSSRLVYWLWHVKEDGFHVTRSFVSTLPLPSEPALKRLAELGITLWSQLQGDQIVSVNGGRKTIAYRPHSLGRTRDEIDSVMLSGLGIEDAFGAYLRAFTRAVVTVDESDESRRRFTGHFTDTDTKS